MGDTQYPLLATKLYVPKPKPGLVRRTHLVEKLSASVQQKLTLISAPAGFGKTTLLTEWVSQNDMPIVWISLDKGDNDPVYFLNYVIAALQNIQPDIGKDALILLQSPQQTSMESVLAELTHEIADIKRDFVLVLDDYHSIDSRKIHNIVEFLIDHLPHQMHIIIASRMDPPLPLARLRARNQLTELRTSDLCFAFQEISQFFEKTINLELSKDEVSKLESRTEGWIAGLQLAALSMQGRDDIHGFINSFAGDDRHIVDYLAEEVLNLQPGHVQNFLLQTSVLNRLSASLCSYVTNQENSQEMLTALEKANLFIVPLDNKRHWYRYHHLFADLLRQKLNQTQGNKVRNLHIKACEWFDKNQFREDAIEHAFAAEDFKQAAELIEKHTEAEWQGGEQVTLFSWLEKLPDESKLNNPNLGINYSRVLFENGQHEAAEQILNKLEDTHAPLLKHHRLASEETLKNPEAQKAIVLQGRIAAIKTYWATLKGDIDGITAYSKEALDCLPQKNLGWRAIVALGAAVANDIKGDLNTAINAHREAVSIAREAGDVYFYLITRLWLAIELNILGHLPESIDICQQLLKEVSEHKLTFNVAIGLVSGTWGEMLYELNELDEASRYTKKGINLLEEGHDVHHLGWRYSCLVKILCSKKDIAGALEVVPKMDKLVQEAFMPPWVTSHIEAVKARIWLAQGNLDRLEQWTKDYDLKPDGDFTRFSETKYMMFARLLVNRGFLDDALGLINRLIKDQEKGGRALYQIETLLIQAQAYTKKDNTPEAMCAVKKALSLAEPGGYVRVFVDEGPHISELLEKILKTKDKIPRTFIKKLMPAFKLRNIISTNDSLVEQLSDRELEVLQFIAAGLSNKKITEELFISVSTVKTHLRNIYGKLDVHSRTEAVVKAKELSLL